MSTLNSCDEELKTYLHDHHLPDLFESLLTALAVNQPQDGKGFIIDKIKLLQDDPSLFATLQWDTFIDEDRRPANRMKMVNFSWLPDEDQPSIEMLEKAYTFYNKKLLKLTFGSLHTYWRFRKEKKEVMEKQLKFAKKYFVNKFHSIYLTRWLEWIRFVKEKQDRFMCTLRSVYHISLERAVFNAWYNLMLDAKNTREYFEKIERGEIVDPSVIGGEKKDHISLLSQHIAANIFRFLDLPDLVSCSRVCCTWKEITQATVLWSRIDLANAEKGLISNRGITSLIQKCRPFLCHLNIRGCDFLLRRALTSIGDCHNLQDLNVSYCQTVDDQIMKDISAGCASLLYVNMAHTNISDASIRYLSRNCSSLQYLNIAHCTNISNRGLQYLSSGKGSQKLVYIDLSACEQITKDGYQLLMKGCTRLNTIYLNELPSLTDHCIQNITRECKTLRVLSLLHSSIITDSSMKFIASSRKLQVLKIEGNNRLTDASVKTLVRLSPDIRYLYFVDMQRITDMSLKILSQCRNLQVLNLADCVRLSDTGVRYLVEGFSAAKLRELNLTNCIRVSDVSLLRISQKCHSLAYVNFSYCEHITDAGVELISNIDSLISIDLSGCNITDSGVIALANNPNFKDIIISECCSVTNTGIQKLVSQVKDLETFDIAHVDKVDDTAIKTLAFCCRKLRVLNVSGCHLLTDQGLQYLSGVCRFIEKLDISGCKLVTDRAMRFIRKGCLNLKSLSMLYCKGISKVAALKMQAKIRGDVLHNQENTLAYLGNRVT